MADQGTTDKSKAKRSTRNKANAPEPKLEALLWVADKLRGHMDAAEYKHVVLGLIFLKTLFIVF
jgi:type I restriction enzyme M protein